MSEIFNFDDGKKRFEVRLRRDENNEYYVILKDNSDEEKELTVTAKVLGSGQFQFTLDNIIYKCSVAKDGDLRFIHLDGQDYELRRVSDSEEDFEETEEEGSLSSPMPGRLVKLFVKEGEKIVKGQDLLVIEAMKMENKLSAPFDGIIKRIFYDIDDQVEANVPLMEIEALEALAKE
ncbi:MAG: acetyl-CoA carboxylase biotin carboxyl carrier protein subunit [Candidatus Hodarchaeales archaeon]|jgi:3-methylcrotonyl-CoA carboxylase alpha subunit